MAKPIDTAQDMNMFMGNEQDACWKELYTPENEYMTDMYLGSENEKGPGTYVKHTNEEENGPGSSGLCQYK